MEPEPQSKELTVTHLHPGVSRERICEMTGWAIRFAENMHETPRPSELELNALRDLERRTALAHGEEIAAPL
jgi:glutaconate CoA-transferase subunit B